MSEMSKSETSESPMESTTTTTTSMIKNTKSIKRKAFETVEHDSDLTTSQRIARSSYDTSLGVTDEDMLLEDPSPSGGSNFQGYAHDLRRVAEEQFAFSTKWNDEFQKYYEMPTSTPWELLERARKINKIYEEFIKTAVRIGKTIIEELSFASESKTINRLPQEHGIAGGEKFCCEGIFFKLATDPYRLYGGDYFSMKAAGHEMKAINELMKCNEGGIHLPMMTLIDYCGYRLVAVAALPINRHSIVYGSDNGCKTIYDRSEELRSMIARAAEKLCLKLHIAGMGLCSDPRLLHFPADVEGHMGLDGRYYIVDVQRLFPAENDFSKTFGVLVPCDEKQDIRHIWIDRTSYDKEISRVLGEESEWIEQSFPETLLVSYSTAPQEDTSDSDQEFPDNNYDTDNENTKEEDSKTSKSTDTLETVSRTSNKRNMPLNKRASTITGASIYGDTFFVLGDVEPCKREVLFYMIRPEWIRKNRPIAVSSDVFTKFGLHNKEEHEREVHELRRKLVEEHIPQFANWLMKHNTEIASCAHLVKLLHKNGINLRYLGYLFMHIPDDYMRLKYDIVGFGMISRLIAEQLQAKLRSITIQSITAYKEAVVHFFNLVLGDGEASSYFWETEMPVFLMLKYGPFGFVYDRQYGFQHLLGHYRLFHLLQVHTGIVFKSSVFDRFLSANIYLRGPNPINISDIEEISVKIKRWDWKVLPFIESVSRSPRSSNPYSSHDIELNKTSDSELLERLTKQLGDSQKADEKLLSLQSRRQHLGLVVDIYGLHSVESSTSTFWYALELSECGEYHAAKQNIINGIKIFNHLGFVPREILYGCLRVIGVVLQNLKENFLAKNVMLLLLKNVREFWDSTRHISASPFEVDLHERLAALYELTGNAHSAVFHRLEQKRILEFLHSAEENQVQLSGNFAGTSPYFIVVVDTYNYIIVILYNCH
eukprot:TRINITY_DN233_c0_g1_i1.p1 TRINITY_DN233_c0_g1~~TRINITY_DN233_c0_g1_i1.p1  ORF type:complete len:937 (-),score=152.85 TRINITY_DN233_c0_g1_i1:135-2945(-)